MGFPGLPDGSVESGGLDLLLVTVLQNSHEWNDLLRKTGYVFAVKPNG